MSSDALAVQTQAGPAMAVPGPQLAAAEADSAPVESASAPLDDTDVYRLALLKIKGHLGVARALLQVRAPGVDYHLRQPIEDILREIEAELEARGAPFSADVLEQLEHAPQGEPAAALATIETAVTAVDGSFAQTGALDSDSTLGLAEGLLRDAVASYGEAVKNNEVVELHKYQSGRGFVTEAEALIRYAGGLKGRPGHESLLKSVVLIRQAWPGIVPPPIVFDPQSVAGRFEEAAAAMKELR